MDEILVLRDKRAALVKETRAFLDSLRDVNNGIVSPENEAIYNKKEAEITAITEKIEMLERFQHIENKLTGGITKPLVTAPGSGVRGTSEYAQAFWNAMRGRGVSNALSVGVDTSGGYLVPEEFANELVQALQEQNIFRAIARLVPTSREKLKVPISNSDGAVNWIGENMPIPETTMTFNQIVLNAYKLGGLIKSSTELLEDSAFPLEQFVAGRFAQLIGAEEERTFCVGDGNDKPTGIFTDAGGAEIGATATSATAITFDDVIDLMHSIKKPYRGKAVFVTNDSTIRELRKIKDNNGQYIWQPAVKDVTPDTVVGRPVYTSPFVPEIAAEALVMAFGDFSYYWISDRREMRFKVLNERYAENDQVGFYATQRVDGKLVLPEAVKLLKMGDD